ncbi:MAG: hypothetical protein K2M46_06125 [Lachnospiraceae bacterium]|nr:hypothetical protein [Lachnospiraceae bacterium]
MAAKPLPLSNGFSAIIHVEQTDGTVKDIQSWEELSEEFKVLNPQALRAVGLVPHKDNAG